METLDNARNQSKDIMKLPDMEDKVKQFSKEKGVSLEAAKNHFLYLLTDQP